MSSSKPAVSALDPSSRSGPVTLPAGPTSKPELALTLPPEPRHDPALMQTLFPSGLSDPGRAHTLYPELQKEPALAHTIYPEPSISQAGSQAGSQSGSQSGSQAGNLAGNLAQESIPAASLPTFPPPQQALSAATLPPEPGSESAYSSYGPGTVSLGAAARTEFPVANWERYEFLHLLGQGGMGAVYKVLFLGNFRRNRARNSGRGTGKEWAVGCSVECGALSRCRALRS